MLVDGQNVMDNVYSGQRVKIIFDAVEETQVLVGAIPAEYGYIEGGVVNTISKTGGNEFSGSIRYDLSNPNWNAVAPTQRASDATSGADSRPFAGTTGWPSVEASAAVPGISGVLSSPSSSSAG